MKKVYWTIGLVGVPLAILFGVWQWFHSIPTQADLRNILDRADNLEVVELKAGKPTRFTLLKEKELWKDLSASIHYRQRYWLFSDEPDDSIVIQAFIGEKKRIGVFEIREDHCIHIRKAVRWYRMPVESGTLTWAQQLLDSMGKPVIPNNRPRGEENPQNTKEVSPISTK